jgi:hypothetical protein
MSKFDNLKKALKKDSDFDSKSVLNTTYQYFPTIKARYICKIVDIRAKESRDGDNFIIVELEIVENGNLENVANGDRFAHLIKVDPTTKRTLSMIARELSLLFISAMGVVFENKAQWDNEVKSVVSCWEDKTGKQLDELLFQMVTDDDIGSECIARGNLIEVKTSVIQTKAGSDFTKIEYYGINQETPF